MTATVDPNVGPEAADTAPDVIAYIEAVRFHLSDLDADELDDLVDDLELHLVEVRAETEAPFEEVIGTAEAFAAELRASAGLGTAPPPPARGGRVTTVVDRIVTRLATITGPVRGHRWTRAAIDFLPELRPAWWVARGYLMAVFLALVTSPSDWRSAIGVPRVFGSLVIGLVTIGVFVVASVRFGRARRSGRRVRLITVATTLASIVAALVVIAGMDGSTVYVSDPVFIVEPDAAVLPSNIHAYLPDGTPLDGVLLYDEAGNPIDLPLAGFSEGLGLEFHADYPLDADGASVVNLYPRDLFGYSEEPTASRLLPVEPPSVGPFAPLPGGDQLEPSTGTDRSDTADE